MPIEVGETIPDVQVQRMTADGVRGVSTREYFAGRRVALFAVPGAFTPTCSETHLPGFLVRADDLRERGVDAVACTAINDAFVLHAWAKATGAAGVIDMLADGNGDLAHALGLDKDSSRWGQGRRSRRYAALVDDGTVTYLGVEPAGEVGVSSAEAVLAALGPAL
jgi:glutaredoxin/glutathione-dependent peroxiredoxin